MNEKDLTRFLSKVRVLPDGCWQWTGSFFSNGYAYFHTGTRQSRKANLGHKIAYEHFVGPVPNGLQLDHVATCRHRWCVNPAHVETVTRKVNMQRAVPFNHFGVYDRVKPTHCPQGHEYTPENTYMYANGNYYCKECNRAASRLTYHKKKGLQHG
ncbi:MAG TPA: HNH endonuclease signature motif containing protein [Gemmatimonadaceae bacterium]|jgi:hypothetical protein